MGPFVHYSPVKIVYSNGVINRLPDLLEGAVSVIVVTGKSSARKSGLIDRVKKILGDGGVETIRFTDAGSNPTITEVNSIAEVARSINAELIIGIGGGSAMDAAKAAAVVTTNTAPFHKLIKLKTFGPEPLPLILVPTTAGTGSEVNQYSIITDEKTNDKVNISGDNTYPNIALLDPELSVTMPPDITVDTGIDALSHAVEGYISRKAGPISDVLALEVFRIVRDTLPIAYRDGSDLDARGKLLYAASLAGIVISHTGTTMVHAMGYHLTLEYGVSHGRANAALLAHGLRYNYRAAPEKIGRFYTIFGGSADESGVGAFLDYLHSLGIKTHLSDYGLSSDDLAEYGRYVMTKRNIENSPAEVSDHNMNELLKEIL